ncbi:MAG: glutamine-hydrolyzing carbamoyl-phosphate synthase small subunit [Myxococcota bacterium]
MTARNDLFRSSPPAVLVLENGRVFRGAAFGAVGETFGEAVFNTSLTGYQEVLTDPSYAGQIVVMTATQIGNTGVNALDRESGQPVCAGFAVRELSPLSSNWRAEEQLDSYLGRHGVVGIQGIDTRAVTRALRQGGAQRAAIVCGEFSDEDAAAIRERVVASPVMEGRDLAGQVTCAESYPWPAGNSDPRSFALPGDVGLSGRAAASAAGEPRFHVVAYDFGIKRTILRGLAASGCRVTVVPATTSAEAALALAPDGLFLSNGPGDPAAVSYGVAATRDLVGSGKPIFGICLGHQILALALGATTYKLPFGHHGGNHPVRELATGEIAITAQNHGFAVDRESLPEGVVETHVNLYDGTVAGFAMIDRPVFGVQYHPEASPGPHDATHLFDRFVAAMTATRAADG